MSRPGVGEAAGLPTLLTSHMTVWSSRAFPFSVLEDAQVLSWEWLLLPSPPQLLNPTAGQTLCLLAGSGQALELSPAHAGGQPVPTQAAVPAH